MQINRLFKIVYLLMKKKSITAKELAAHFEVSKRTILRDIDALATAGIPVYTSQGKGGGISILDRFILDKTVISEAEQEQILFALQGMSATQYIETESILSKLRSLFKKTDKDWIEVDFSRWGNSAEDKARFDTLKNAVINERVVSFTYSSSFGETVERKAYPLKLAFKSTSWYLQAFCLLRNDYRIFKISRMKNVEILAEVFDSKAFKIPEIQTSENQFPCIVDVTLHIMPNATYRVYDEFDERSIIKNKDGSLIVTMSVPNDYWIIDYLLSFGESLEVLAPQSIRDEVIRRAEEIKNVYANKT